MWTHQQGCATGFSRLVWVNLLSNPNSVPILPVSISPWFFTAQCCSSLPREFFHCRSALQLAPFLPKWSLSQESTVLSKRLWVYRPALQSVHFWWASGSGAFGRKEWIRLSCFMSTSENKYLDFQYSLLRVLCGGRRGRGWNYHCTAQTMLVPNISNSLTSAYAVEAAPRVS